MPEMVNEPDESTAPPNPMVIVMLLGVVDVIVLIYGVVTFVIDIGRVTSE